MNTTPRNGAPVSTTPFTSAPKTKRSIQVGSAFDPNLRVPSATERFAKPLPPVRPAVQANPPITPLNLEQLNKTDTGFAKELPKVITNNTDLATFEDSVFEKNNIVAELVEMRVDDRIDNDPFSERIALPSGGIFYNFNSVTIRPFKVPELALLYKAKKNRDITLLNDTVGKTLNVDIRDLWTVDARWVMYWHRMNSFVKTPYLATWESLYGNTNKTKIEFSDIDVTPLSLTKEEYQVWVSKGLKAPNVRDLEHLDTFRDKLSEEDLWMYERALFLQGSDLHQQKKVLEFDENSVEILYRIKEFSKAFSESQIIETSKAKDSFFNYGEAVKHLGADLEMINSILTTEINLKPAVEDLLVERQAKVVSELARLAKFASNPGEAEPMLETITLRLGLLDFFPDIF